MRNKSRAPTCCSVLVVAGGRSRRLGQDKVLLAWPQPPDAAPGADVGPLRGTLIGATLLRLANLTDDLIVVGRVLAASPLYRCVPDNVPGAGPLAGIEAGLAQARHNVAIVVAADMPFLNLGLLRHLGALAHSGQWDAVVPRPGEDPEPLHAAYNARCLPAIRDALQGGLRRMIAFFPQVRVRFLDAPELRTFDPDLRSFLNINTPADLDQAHLQAGG